MGSQIIAVCKCGFNKELSMGGSKMGFHKTMYFPAYCQYCEDIVDSNVRDENLKCLEFEKEGVILYDDSKFIGEKGDRFVDMVMDNILWNGTYFCPSCNDYNLVFKPGSIYWD